MWPIKKQVQTVSSEQQLLLNSACPSLTTWPNSNVQVFPLQPSHGNDLIQQGKVMCTQVSCQEGRTGVKETDMATGKPHSLSPGRAEGKLRALKLTQWSTSHLLTAADTSHHLLEENAFGMAAQPVCCSWVNCSLSWGICSVLTPVHLSLLRHN